MQPVFAVRQNVETRETGECDRKTDKHTNKKTGRQTNRQRDRQTGNQTDRQLAAAYVDSRVKIFEGRLDSQTKQNKNMNINSYSYLCIRAPAAARTADNHNERPYLLICIQ